MSETQNAKVLEHLQSGRALTSITAIQLWKLTRLAARVKELRRRGYDIRTEWQSVGRTRYAVYRLAKQEETCSRN